MKAKERVETVWNRTNKLLHDKIKKIENKSFKSYLSELSATNNIVYSLWKATSRMKSPRAYVPTNRMEDGRWTRCVQDKADMYARQLERVFQPNEVVSELDIAQCQTLNKIHDKIKHFTPVEIAKKN
ncbi:Hypothetical protein CINCED_3A022925 [Cinara cedri]|uniref:Uncharacterized protein n=1 Tax=Cinara cedri TaxID=506608 RepID=A0A5E4N9N7_9HEMI|nr:Hypothetical protein CINCED_3A022925 [Cinara cedri]